MHRKPDSDLFLGDIELERTLRSLRKVRRAKKATIQWNKKQQQEGLQFKIQWKISGGLSSKQNTQQSDSLLQRPTTLS